MRYLNVLDEWKLEQLDIVRDLYSACQSMGVPVDGHIALITRFYSRFPIEQVAPDALSSFRLFFGKSTTFHPYKTVTKFAHLWHLLDKCGPPVLMELITDPVFPPYSGHCL
jgi:hypothetical protein